VTRRAIVGRLTGVFGVRGEIKCLPAPAAGAAFVAGRSLTVGEGESARTLRCRSARQHHEKLLVAFEGIDTPEAARVLCGQSVRADLEDAPLGPDEYLDEDLIGSRLLDPSGNDLGYVVASVVHYPAQDCLIVEPGGGLVPLVKAFVRRIDIEAKTIALDLPEGLL
jgi:16S rRNA processing protein RimM